MFLCKCIYDTDGRFGCQGEIATKGTEFTEWGMGRIYTLTQPSPLGRGANRWRGLRCGVCACRGGRGVLQSGLRRLRPGKRAKSESLVCTYASMLHRYGGDVGVCNRIAPPPAGDLKVLSQEYLMWSSPGLTGTDMLVLKPLLSTYSAASAVDTGDSHCVGISHKPYEPS